MTTTEYVHSLRALADLLETHPELPKPVIGYTTVRFDYWGNDPAEVAKLARAIPGTMAKNDPKESSFDEKYYELTSNIKVGKFTVTVSAYRSSVCERVQTGTETVVVPEVVAVPEHTIERPIYAVNCSPLLEKGLTK